MSDLNAPRLAGMLVPLFSIRNEKSWGVGEIGDLAPLAEWLADAGHGVLQLLPVNEVSPGESSPYSSLSGFAFDPLYISLRDVEDFQNAGGEEALGRECRNELDRVREAARVDHNAVRTLKEPALRLAFEQFRKREQAGRSARDTDFRRFREEHAGWLDEYSLFRALHARFNRYWVEWPAELRDREQGALARQRQELAGEIAFFEYVQWIAERQWQAARRYANSIGVLLKGDLPFMVSGHSADVWADQHLFRTDTEVGAPPDAFSQTGQNWGLPPYDWSAIAEDDYQWLRRRAHRAAEMYDLFRVDHVIGFYRTYNIPKDGSRPFFVPAEEPAQKAQGEAVMRVFQSAGGEVVAEDLGVIPLWVRRSLTELGIAGYRVLRWEREWDEPGQPFRDPVHYPGLSIAVSGTHDTETMATWWESMTSEDRRGICRIPALHELNCDTVQQFTPVVHRALLEALYSAGSRYVVLPEQDIFGTRDRINLPATVNPENWSYRMPLSLSELRSDPRGHEASGRLALLARRHGRSLALPAEKAS